jgi:hypothetical protein
VIELEQRQVQPVGRDDPHTDELLQPRPQAPILVDQVVVELDALTAGDAAEDDQQRFAGLLRLDKAPLQIVVDPEAICLDLLAVGADLLLTRLGGCRAGQGQGNVPAEQYSPYHRVLQG